MDITKKYRWVKIGFVVMLIINVITLATIWLIRPPFDFRTPGQGQRVQQFFQQELNLTDNQQQTFRQLRRQHFQKTGQIRGTLQQLRSEYFDYLANAGSKADTTQMDSIITQISQQQIRLEKEMFQHLSNLRAILDDQQKKKFSEIIETAFRHRHRHQGRQRFNLNQN